MKPLIALLIALALPLLATAAAPATVPPKNCGFMELKGHRYNVKADGLRCATARDYLRRYAVRGRRPGRGWTCKTYSGQALRYRCYKGEREFFGIRRS